MPKTTKETPKKPTKKIALVLTGGGARGAYQVGAIQAVLDIAHECKLPRPFEIVTGNSAGSINAAYLAAHAGNMRGASRRLAQMWAALRSEKVFKIGFWDMASIAGRLILDLSTGGFFKKKKSRGLLNTSPLREIITRRIPFHHINTHIEKGNLHGFAIKAIDYTTGFSKTFFQGHESIQPWRRYQRMGERAQITHDHVLASTAIPFIFPAVKIDNHYYGDGSVRNYTPLSPAIKLGAEKLLVIGVRQQREEQVDGPSLKPTFARLASIMLNAILLDSIDLDHERLSRINETLKGSTSNGSSLKEVDLCLLRPSQDLAEIAYKESPKMPFTIRYLLRGLGTRKEAADIISNLLFESSYTQKLMRLGYKDTIEKKEEIKTFLMA